MSLRYRVLSKEFPLGNDWAKKMLEKIEEWKKEEILSSQTFAQNLKGKLNHIEAKLKRLLDAHLEGVISREEYTAKKERLLNDKLEVKERLEDFERKGDQWLELSSGGANPSFFLSKSLDHPSPRA